MACSGHVPDSHGCKLPESENSRVAFVVYHVLMHQNIPNNENGSLTSAMNCYSDNTSFFRKPQLPRLATPLQRSEFRKHTAGKCILQQVSSVSLSIPVSQCANDSNSEVHYPKVHLSFKLLCGKGDKLQVLHLIQHCSRDCIALG